VVDAVDATFAEVVDRAQLPVLVDLWAPWCGPCRMVSPVLERLATTRAGRVKLVRVNVEEAPQVAGRFQARAIPTLLVMARGQVLSRRAGAAPEAELGAWLDDALQRASGHEADGRHSR
jgi:thioredoxin 2